MFRWRQAKGSSGDGKGALLAADSLLTLLDTLHASPVAKVTDYWLLNLSERIRLVV